MQIFVIQVSVRQTIHWPDIMQKGSSHGCQRASVLRHTSVCKIGPQWRRHDGRGGGYAWAHSMGTFLLSQPLLLPLLKVSSRNQYWVLNMVHSSRSPTSHLGARWFHWVSSNLEMTWTVDRDPSCLTSWWENSELRFTLPLGISVRLSPSYPRKQPIINTA